MCACAGKHEVSPVSFQAIAAIVITTAVQACLAYAWMRTAGRGSAGRSEAAELAAWLAPFVVLLAGSLLRAQAKRVPGRVEGPNAGAYPSEVAISE
jgi:hypothetical protein